MSREKPALRLVEPKPIAGRVPPHDLDAEAAVLSAILLEASAFDTALSVLGDCIGQNEQREQHPKFYSDANARVMAACSALRAANTPIDIVNVAAWLRDREWLREVGGAAYLAQLSDATPAVAHVASHARIVLEKWKLRQVIATCQRIAAEGYGDVGDVQTFIAAAESSVGEIARLTSGSRIASIAEGIDEAYATLMQVKARAGQVFGYTTGLLQLDEMLGGMAPSDVTLVGARMKMSDGRIETTSAYKSAFTAGLAVHVAETPYRTLVRHEDGTRSEQLERIGVLIFPLEMTHAQMCMRIACREARVSWDEIKNGKLIDPVTGDLRGDVNARICEAMGRLRRLPIKFESEKPLTPSVVRAKVIAAREEFAKLGVRLGLVLLDSIGLMSPDRASRDNNRERELNDIGRALRLLSTDERIPGIHYLVVTQVQEDGRPKDCRSLADHAVNFLLVEMNDNPDAEELDGNIVVRKQRDGRRGNVPVRLLKRYGLLTDQYA